MSRPILIRGARQLLSLHGPPGPRRGADLRQLGIIQDGAVLIVDGLIREVGPTRRLDNLADSRQAQEINAVGKVVMPGFVDSHIHVVSGPARLGDFEMHLAGASPNQIVEAGGGFPAMVKAIQEAPVRSLEAQAWHVIRESIRQGTTSLEAKSGYGVNETGEVKILRTHAAVNRHFHNVISTFMSAWFLPAEHAQSPEEYVDWVCNHMLPLVRRRNLAEFAGVVFEEDLFTLQHYRRILETARLAGLGIKVHAGQTRNDGGVRLAVEMGAVSVDHAIHLDPADIALLATSNTIATLLPGPVFYLGTQRYAPARALIDRGAAVALATNYNPQTCPTHNMQMIVALACRKMGMTPAEAISAATINGAYATGRGEKIGSIEFGKHADIIMLSVPDYREIPYHFGVNLVEMTMKRGEVIYQASEVKCPAG